MLLLQAVEYMHLPVQTSIISSISCYDTEGKGVIKLIKVNVNNMPSTRKLSLYLEQVVADDAAGIHVLEHGNDLIEVDIQRIVDVQKSQAIQPLLADGASQVRLQPPETANGSLTLTGGDRNGAEDPQQAMDCWPHKVVSGRQCDCSC